MCRETGTPKILVSENWLFQSSVSWSWPKGTWALETRLFRDVESAHAWKITSSQWVFLTLNWAYTSFIPDSVESCESNCTEAHCRTGNEFRNSLTVSFIIYSSDLLKPSENCGSTSWEKWNVVEHLRPSDEFSKLSSVEEVNLWKSA